MMAFSWRPLPPLERVQGPIHRDSTSAYSHVRCLPSWYHWATESTWCPEEQDLGEVPRSATWSAWRMEESWPLGRCSFEVEHWASLGVTANWKVFNFLMEVGLCSVHPGNNSGSSVCMKESLQNRYRSERWWGAEIKQQQQPCPWRRGCLSSFLGILLCGKTQG